MSEPRSRPPATPPPLPPDGATGEWTLHSLQAELTARGLTTGVWRRHIRPAIWIPCRPDYGGRDRLERAVAPGCHGCQGRVGGTYVPKRPLARGPVQDSSR